MARILEGRNRATADEAASFASEIDRIEQQREIKLAEIDAEFKKRKRDANKECDGEQDAIYEDAKKQGVAKGTLRAIIAGQARIRKAQERVESAKEKARDGLDDLEDEARDQAIDIVKALGDDFAGFGLGAAAVKRENGDADDAGEETSDQRDPVAAAADEAWSSADPANKQPA